MLHMHNTTNIGSSSGSGSGSGGACSDVVGLKCGRGLVLVLAHTPHQRHPKQSQVAVNRHRLNSQEESSNSNHKGYLELELELVAELQRVVCDMGAC